MFLRALWCLVLFALCAASSRSGTAAEVPLGDEIVRVVNTTSDTRPTTLTLNRSSLADLPRQRVTAIDHGTPGNFEGVNMLELLRKAGAPLDKSLRGAHLASYALITAADGYQVVFALAEFDPAFGASPAILADMRDDAPLNDHEGPFRIIVGDEERSGRWIRQVVRIELISARTDEKAKPVDQPHR
jgi:hypothetical protein